MSIFSKFTHNSTEEQKKQTLLDIAKKMMGIDHIPGDTELNAFREAFAETIDFSDYKQCDAYLDYADPIEGFRRMIYEYYYTYKKPNASEEEKAKAFRRINYFLADNVARTLRLDVRDPNGFNTTYKKIVSDIADERIDAKERESLANRFNLFINRTKAINNL